MQRPTQGYTSRDFTRLLPTLTTMTLDDLTEEERRDIIEDDIRGEVDALDDDTLAGANSTSHRRLLKSLAVAAEESLDSSTFKSYKQYVRSCS